MDSLKKNICARKNGSLDFLSGSRVYLLNSYLRACCESLKHSSEFLAESVASYVDRLS